MTYSYDGEQYSFDAARMVYRATQRTARITARRAAHKCDPAARQCREQVGPEVPMHPVIRHYAAAPVDVYYRDKVAAGLIVAGSR